MFKLYKHQKHQNKIVRNALKKDNHIIFGASTGFGKSACIWDFVKRELENNRKVLVLAPRKTLVHQLTTTLKQFKPFMIINSQRLGDYRSNLIISSKQTTNRQLKINNKCYENIDTIMIDEIHLGGNFPPKPNTEFYALYIKYWNIAKWLGFSATPITAKGHRLEGWCKTIYEYQTAQLIDMGFLSDYDYFAPEEIDLSKLHVSSMGEYVAEDVEEVTNMPVAIDSVKKQWLKYRKTKKILIFASSINHAELLYKEFKDCGIVHSKQTELQQKKVLLAFKNNEITTIINVGILTTGFDDPSVDCLILARPIKSELLAIQVWGRALRLLKGQIKKALILDMCSVYVNCGLPKDLRDFNKKYIPREKIERNEDEDEKTTKCPHCKNVFDSKDIKIKKKTKKKFIITRKYCPICKEMIDEIRADLTQIKKLRKIEEAKTKVYTNQERYIIICDLISEHTSAKRSWARHILKAIIANDNIKLLDQAINKGTTTRTLWKKIMDMKGD